MYQQNKFDLPFCGLSMRLFPTGNQSPKYEYSGEASKVKFTCSLTKKKYKLSQVDEWYHTEGVQNFVKQGYTGKWFAKTQQIENPKQIPSFRKKRDRLPHTSIPVLQATIC